MQEAQKKRGGLWATVVFRLAIGLGIFVVILVILAVEQVQCTVPTNDAHRILARYVAIRETQELEESGKLGDLDSELRSEKPYPRAAGLDHYRIVVRKVSGGYDVILQPMQWCFCRSTFVLHNGGWRVEVLPPSW